MRLFYDEALTKPLDKKGVDLGEVWFMEPKTQTIWLFNETPGVLRDIKVSGLDGCVSVECPEGLTSREKAPIRFTWKPQTLAGLRATVEVVATEVYTG